jgi:hypothetical protein
MKRKLLIVQFNSPSSGLLSPPLAVSSKYVVHSSPFLESEDGVKTFLWNLRFYWRNYTVSKLTSSSDLSSLQWKPHIPPWTCVLPWGRETIFHFRESKASKTAEVFQVMNWEGMQKALSKSAFHVNYSRRLFLCVVILIIVNYAAFSKHLIGIFMLGFIGSFSHLEDLSLMFYEKLCRLLASSVLFSDRKVCVSKE